MSEFPSLDFRFSLEAAKATAVQNGIERGLSRPPRHIGAQMLANRALIFAAYGSSFCCQAADAAFVPSVRQRFSLAMYTA